MRCPLMLRRMDDPGASVIFDGVVFTAAPIFAAMAHELTFGLTRAADAAELTEELSEIWRLCPTTPECAASMAVRELDREVAGVESGGVTASSGSTARELASVDE